jgi:hypothetical protein
VVSWAGGLVDWRVSRLVGGGWWVGGLVGLCVGLWVGGLVGGWGRCYWVGTGR